MVFVVKVATMIPEAFPGVLGHCLAGKALSGGAWSLGTVDIKEHGIGKHRKVDDRPFGGGAGMVIMAEVAASALDQAKQLILDECGRNDPRVVYVSARGKSFTQSVANKIVSDARPLIILCGRFEGIDQRVIELYSIEEWCIGNFVLSGGEIAAMAMIDTCVRLLPGVMGNEVSAHDDSFNIYHHGSCLVEYPHYTRPRSWRGLDVPELLVSGNHSSVETWRKEEAYKATVSYRPDLLEKES